MHEPATIDQADLPATLEELDLLARQRFALPARGPAAERARQLLDHVESYLLPRARSLDAPLLVLVLGPTGSGKSTLTNSLVGAPVSRTGVLRPTTRDAVVAADPSDFERLGATGALARLPSERLRLVPDAGPAPGLVIVDAPDIDSVELDNRALADRLVESADLAIFVTTATRYADRVPWDVLGRVAARGLPLVVVVNRVPPRSAAGEEPPSSLVTSDLRRLLSEAGLAPAPGGASETTRAGSESTGGAADTPGRPGPAGGGAGTRRLPAIVTVAEGALDPEVDGLDPGSIEPVLTLLRQLEADRDARRSLAKGALRGALAGIGALIQDVADDLEHEAIDADALRRTAETSYAAELSALLDRLASGTFLREGVLRSWHEFVGADQVTRLFASGIGRIQGTLLSLVKGTPAPPVAVVSEATTGDLAALARSHAAEAARRTAQRWSSTGDAEHLVDLEPGLWIAGPAVGATLESRLHEWMASIVEDVRRTGAEKRGFARGAAIGVNGAGVAVMLAVFAHTGGLTGAEVGVAAGTAFLNQKLLNALFGEAAVVRLIEDARRRLEAILVESFGKDRERFVALVPAGDDLRRLAGGLRAIASTVGVRAGGPDRKVALGLDRTPGPADASTAPRSP